MFPSCGALHVTHHLHGIALLRLGTIAELFIAIFSESPSAGVLFDQDGVTSPSCGALHATHHLHGIALLRLGTIAEPSIVIIPETPSAGVLFDKDGVISP